MPGAGDRNGDAGIAARRAEAARLVSEGYAAADRGDGDRTIERLTAALDILRGLAADPGHDADLLELGALGYAMGPLHMGARDPAGALEALYTAEHAYVTLAERRQEGEGEPDTALDAKIADVRMRRAAARRMLGQDLSALVDADAAVMGYLYLYDRHTGPDSPPLPARAGEPVDWTLDLARVLSLHSHVLLSLGDADLAVGAADTAIRLYLGAAADINADPGRQSVHLDRMGQAIAVAHAVHSAFDRTGPATAALAVAEAAGMPEVPELATRESVLYFPTFAEALHQLDADADLQRALTLPAASEDMDATLFATGQRGHPDNNVERGLALAELAQRAMATQPLAGFRIVTETHVLLLRCQDEAPDRVAALAADLRPAWADMLRACSEWAAESDPDDLAGAVDIAGHMSLVVADISNDIADDVTGNAQAGSDTAAAVVERCNVWQQRLIGSLAG